MLSEHAPIIPALRKPKQEDCYEFEASLGYIARPCLRNKAKQNFIILIKYILIIKVNKYFIFFSRFENWGIFIVMLEVIFRTLLRSTGVFIFLLLAFGLSFYVLLNAQVRQLHLLLIITVNIGNVCYI